MKILAVDDDQCALDILEAVLRGADYQEVVTAISAESALEKLLLEQQPFDCILLDIQMPNMDGVELCRLIRSMQSYEATPIIMISALNDQRDIDKAMAAGATDYVTKPFNGLDLGARLRAASFLADTLQKRAKENLQLNALQTELSRLYKHDLETAVELEPKSGVVTDLQLENGLLKLPEGIHGLEIIAFAIANIGMIFDELETLDFRIFLNSITDRILDCVESSRATIAYFGNGIFVVVLRSTPGNQKREAKIRLALEGTHYPELDKSEVRPVIVSSKPEHTDYWSAQSASGGLDDALKNVQAKCAHHLYQSRLANFRNEIRHEAAGKHSKLWFLHPSL